MASGDRTEGEDDGSFAAGLEDEDVDVVSTL
jgi:hypothetical protein